LLEADVNFKIVKQFMKNVTDKAVGVEVLEGLNPGQQVIKIVRYEIVDLMGTTQSLLTYSSKSPTVYMMAGLQGAGKTTTTGKLAGLIRKQGKKPLLVACDVYRPAAVKQLQVVGKNFNIPVYDEGQGDPVKIAENGVAYAKSHGNDVVIIDTAGRLHINEELMDELVNIKKAVHPQEILLVIDAMTGQDAVNVAKTFDEKLGIDGTIITKLDGDTRGGAALSVRSVTGKPIKYVGMGEKPDDLEPFYPDRMASRILGMGDVLTLIDKAQTAFDEKQVKELERKMRANDFNLEDFMVQMQQVKKMGSIKDLLGMIPGMSKLNISDADIDEKALVHVEAIIQSMTVKERRNPEILNGSRKRRIAKGSGRSIQEINKLLKQFDQMRSMMKMMGDMKKGRRGLKLPFMR
ncbi:MAG: signal recognition particle protein, partial [Eubacterium sp.]|nr:signal recognition particle protein [Eubacterium sp.]